MMLEITEYARMQKTRIIHLHKYISHVALQKNTQTTPEYSIIYFSYCPVQPRYDEQKGPKRHSERCRCCHIDDGQGPSRATIKVAFNLLVFPPSHHEELVVQLYIY